MTARTRDKLFGLLMYLPALVCLGVFILYPLSMLLVNSTFHYDLLASDSKAFVGLSNYVKFSRSRGFFLHAGTVYCSLESECP